MFRPSLHVSQYVCIIVGLYISRATRMCVRVCVQQFFCKVNLGCLSLDVEGDKLIVYTSRENGEG